MNFQVAIPIVLYLAIVFYIGYLANRSIAKTKASFLNEYFIGNRSMGGFVLAMTLVATYVSASSFIGGPGMASMAEYMELHICLSASSAFSQSSLSQSRKNKLSPFMLNTM